MNVPINVPTIGTIVTPDEAIFLGRHLLGNLLCAAMIAMGRKKKPRYWRRDIKKRKGICVSELSLLEERLRDLPDPVLGKIAQWIADICAALVRYSCTTYTQIETMIKFKEFQLV